MVAGFLLESEVSDLCIGKPPIRWLPPSSTVARAVAELEADGAPGAAVAVWDGQAGAAVAGRLRMADVLLFLCADDGSGQATLADLLAAAGAPPVRRVEPDASVLEAVDALLGGAQSLVVPIRDNRHRPAQLEAESMCWLTVEDVVRFFLGSVALFSHIALRSVSDLGAVRPALAVAPGHDALFAVEPLLRAALATHASVAVVSGRCLVGEISPLTICSSLDAPTAALSPMSLVDSARAPREAALGPRLRSRNLHGVLDLLNAGGRHLSCPSSSSSSSSSSASSSSSSDGEDDDEKNVISAFTSTGRQAKFSARWTKGVIACRRGSSLVAVMAQAVAHRVTQVWVLDDEPEGEELVGVVGLVDVLRVLRRHLLRAPPAHTMAE
ncbi:CBS domain-containing protein CBSX5-like [Triticum urartu]|uniref:CBS domain-containing protein CBSX5-like n=1 Tax=Triticum urartu TaxID=4572 RepID=UPI0020434A22|nr:CBS domain-containing protein CBSX5-like [Triticum urartu]